MLDSDQLLMEMVRRQKRRAELSKACKHVTACMHTHTHIHVARNHWELGFFLMHRMVSGYIWQCRRSWLVWVAQCLCRLPMTVTADWNVGMLTALASEAKDWNTTRLLPATQQLLWELPRVACCNPDRSLPSTHTLFCLLFLIVLAEA